MLHHHDSFQANAETIALPRSNASFVRPLPARAQDTGRAGAWWIVPVVLGGASIWVYGIATVIGKLTGAA